MVSDREILDAYRLTALSGVFCEPASAASVAGFLAYAKKGYFEGVRKERKKSVLKAVCILTGHGLKDPERAIASVDKPVSVEPDYRRVVREIGL